MSLLYPLCGVADVLFDEIVFPVDCQRRVAVDCHVQLPSSRTCEDKFRKCFENLI